MRWLGLVGLAVVLSGCGREEEAEGRAPAPRAVAVPPISGEALPGRVLMVIASRDFRDEELETPRQLFAAAGLDVYVASSTLDSVKGMLGARVKPDVLVSDAEASDYDAVVLVGGVGAQEYWDDPVAHKLCRQVVESGGVLGAICLAPVTPARAGVLEGKRAVVWRDNRRDLEEAGAAVESKGVHVVTDGSIVTGDGPDAAAEFAEAVLAALRAR